MMMPVVPIKAIHLFLAKLVIVAIVAAVLFGVAVLVTIEVEGWQRRAAAKVPARPEPLTCVQLPACFPPETEGGPWGCLCGGAHFTCFQPPTCKALAEGGWACGCDDRVR